MRFLDPASVLALSLLAFAPAAAPAAPAAAPATPAAPAAPATPAAPVAPAAPRTAPTVGLVDAALIPADARWLAHLQLGALLDSELFSSLGEIDAELDFDVNPDVREMRAVLGFDPFAEVHSITAYGTSRDEDSVVVMVRGSARLEQAFALLDQHLDRSTHDVDGVELTRWEESGSDGDPVYTYLARKAGSEQRMLLVAVHADDLTEGVNALRGHIDSLADRPGVLDLDADPGAFVFVSASAKLAQLARDQQVDEFARLVDRARVQVGERDGKLFVELDVTTRSAGDAMLATQILQGGMAVLSLAARNDPDLEQALPLLQKLRFGAEGKRLAVSFEEDVGSLFELLRELEDDSSSRPGPAVFTVPDDAPASDEPTKADGWY